MKWYATSLTECGKEREWGRIMWRIRDMLAAILLSDAPDRDSHRIKLYSCLTDFLRSAW